MQYAGSQPSQPAEVGQGEVRKNRYRYRGPKARARGKVRGTWSPLGSRCKGKAPKKNSKDPHSQAGWLWWNFRVRGGGLVEMQVAGYWILG